MGHDAAIGISSDQFQAYFLAVDQGLQRVAGFLAPGLVELRRIDVGQTDFHLAAVGVDHETVPVLDPDHGLGGAHGGENHARKQ